jgi:hypothetical protein
MGKAARALAIGRQPLLLQHVASIGADCRQESLHERLLSLTGDYTSNPENDARSRITCEMGILQQLSEGTAGTG